MKKNVIMCAGIAGIVFLAGCGSSPRAQEVTEVGSASDGYVNDRQSIDQLLATEDVKTSIDLGSVLGGGVPKDGIPPIDRPEFSSVANAPAWLNSEGDGILIERDGQSRFYPYQVLVSHEIVNEEFAGEQLLVTYCPLCFTGVVFDPTVNGEAVEFGVSGKLWESNLLMYNRSDPESLWSQALGEAVVGPATGDKLDIVRFDITQYGKYASSFPDGEVLIGDQDNPRFGGYSRTPYGGDLRNIDPIFPFSGEDDRLEKTDIILGLLVEGEPHAFLVSALEQDGSFTQEFSGRTIEMNFDEATGVAVFSDVTSGDAERLTPIPSFWISWVSIHPDTSLYK